MTAMSGRPIDRDAHARVAVARQEHPEWSLRRLATECGVSLRTVQAVVPKRGKAPKGVRVVIPRHLYDACEADGGWLAVLERHVASQGKAR